ncbi:alpha/beta fold hydrolase [Thalassotalea aquiviva]|uniref:alpha/beta fold hydrolase n=1 Tax=Thalassotalea aquiviva TaxID=3242415 RepID=UPI00352A46C8
MTKAHEFSLEETLLERYQSEIANVWKQGEFRYFNSFDGLHIHYALFDLKPAAPWIVMSPGRVESYIKYKELTYDLINQGYNVAIIDHRGQGLSDRMLDDPHKGYVQHFDDYAKDLQQFITTIVQPKAKNNLFLLAHSMGSAIALRHEQLFGQQFQAIALTSPMIAIKPGSIPPWLAKPYIYLYNFFDGWFNEQSSYLKGYGPYKAKPFKDNDLMQSSMRYQLFRQEYQDNPKVQLGGTTYRWLQQAFKTESKIFQQLGKLATPVLILQAQNDTVVRNDKQNEFCQKLAKLNKDGCYNKQPMVIENGLHELLFETDKIRNTTLNAIINWFKTKS